LKEGVSTQHEGNNSFTERNFTIKYCKSIHTIPVDRFMPLKIFIDTEFTDFIDPHLISIGMAAEYGEEFYAEVPYPREVCSAFVRETVLPLLGHMPYAACPIDDLRIRIITWIEIVRRSGEDVEICFDFQTDWDLFVSALDNRVPSWCRSRCIDPDINELLRHEFHKKSKLPEHHALYDALANRYAFRERPNTST
jgi:hypothetical protein